MEFAGVASGPAPVAVAHRMERVTSRVYRPLDGGNDEDTHQQRHDSCYTHWMCSQPAGADFRSTDAGWSTWQALTPGSCQFLPVALIGPLRRFHCLNWIHDRRSLAGA